MGGGGGGGGGEVGVGGLVLCETEIAVKRLHTLGIEADLHVDLSYRLELTNVEYFTDHLQF